MANILCPVHGFSHLSSNTDVIKSIHKTYDTNRLRTFEVNGKLFSGRLRSCVLVGKSYNYAFEMGTECPDGYSEKNHETFTCKKKRGILLTDPKWVCSDQNKKHQILQTLSYKMLDVDSICCIYEIDKLSLFPSIGIGGKCSLNGMTYKHSTGVCKWIGKINSIECIGIEMTSWISNDCSGSFMGIKIFDCRHGYGIFVKSTDIVLETVDPTELLFWENGLVDLRNIYYAKKVLFNDRDLLSIDSRVKVLTIECNKYGTICNKDTFGLVKWSGIINKGMCIGLELDYPSKYSMNGVINDTESFNCEPGCGVICRIGSVTFDYYSYSVQCTVDESFTLDSIVFPKEDWDQDIVRERDLKINTNIYAHIKTSDTILNFKGVLKWLGYIQKTSVAVLEMDIRFPITEQQKITKIIKDPKPVAHMIFNTKYLFNYRTIKCYEKFKEDSGKFEIGSKTKFGVVKWKGVDESNHLLYGFEMESPSDTSGNGTFKGQELFQCSEGCGILKYAKDIETVSKNKSKDLSQCGNINVAKPEYNIDDMLTLVTTLAGNHGISTDELLTTAVSMNNPSILVPLINNMNPPINIYKYDEIINQLLESQSFDILETSLVKCVNDNYNSKQLLRVAAESLKYGNSKLFEGCMNKCVNRDTLLDNGETFITYIIKEKVDQSSIIEALQGYEFDLTKANKDGCIPLTLAFTNMMMDVVDYIVKYMKNQEINKKVCSICMDRSIKTVFNCGHNSCKECAENITQCHICKENIVTRGLLYLN